MTMHAAVLTGPGALHVAAVPRPEPGPGEIRVRLEGCGVCASNLTPWAGPDWMCFPTEPGGLGHEGWGVVDAVGPGVEGLAPGDRVATLFGRSYAEFDTGPADQALRLPDSLGGQPFPGEPLGCAMNIFRRAEIAPGQTLAIIGIGFLGALLTRLATEAGARVIAISRRAYALEVARHMGAAETIPMDDHHAIIDRGARADRRRVLRARDRGGGQAMAAGPGRRANADTRAPGDRGLPPGRAAPGEHAALELARAGRGQRA
jgi:D-arabinose 1-dehydrogenase-like Zn-dependent alcohol dehydrogenase